MGCLFAFSDGSGRGQENILQCFSARILIFYPSSTHLLLKHRTTIPAYRRFRRRDSGVRCRRASGRVRPTFVLLISCGTG